MTANLVLLSGLAYGVLGALTVHAARDARVVHLGRDLDRQWWSERFGVSVDVLVDVVRQVGPRVQDIERYLGIGSPRRRALAA